MPTPVFVSYSWKQGDWVWDRLVPVLKAGGAEVLYDREQFEAARALKWQMDDLQDRARLHILVLSPEYLASKACQHEMKRSITRDPKFVTGLAVPVVRSDCPLPPAIKRPDPIYVDLRDDDKSDQWDLLLRKCDLDLGSTVPDWLRARDAIRRHLRRGISVNLVVEGKASSIPLIDHLRNDSELRMGIVRMDSAETMNRPALVREILAQCGCPAPSQVPDKPRDLVELGRALTSLPSAPCLALTSFDKVVYRRNEYEFDLFVALRYLMMEAQKLVLLVESRTPFAMLLPHDHPLSEIHLATVELKGRS